MVGAFGGLRLPAGLQLGRVDAKASNAAIRPDDSVEHSHPPSAPGDGLGVKRELR